MRVNPKGIRPASSGAEKWTDFFGCAWTGASGERCTTIAAMPPTPVDHGIDAALPAAERARRLHWRRTLCLTGALLLVWFLVGFVITWFARDLDFAFFGWPFSFWVAAQGGVIVFVVLLAVYARRMARNDRRLAHEGGTDDGGTAGAPHR